MPLCRVHFLDRHGVRYLVDVPDAGSVFEAAARALYLFERAHCPPPDDASVTVEVETRSSYNVTPQKIRAWIDADPTAETSTDERARKMRAGSLFHALQVERAHHHDG
jgi:hypothetical protein